jgi:hypothetical protein
MPKLATIEQLDGLLLLAKKCPACANPLSIQPRHGFSRHAPQSSCRVASPLLKNHAAGKLKRFGAIMPGVFWAQTDNNNHHAHGKI